MSGFIHARTTKTLMWLDFYGLCRESYISPLSTQQFLDDGAEGADGVLSELETAVSAKDDKSEAVTDAVGVGFMAAGALIFAATFETGIGAVVGIVVAAIGAIVKFLAKLFYFECDKYHCGGHDRNNKYQRRRYREHQQAVVGVHMIDKKRADLESDCSCKLRSHECTMVKYVHDGMMVNGINFGEVDEEDEASLVKTGRVRGVNAHASGGNAGCTEFWRNHPDAMPLDEDGKQLPKGTTALELENDTNSYYYRAWRVRHLLLWMQDRMLCRTMECMEEVLLNTTSVHGDSKFNQVRRRGSRWYSSIVWMMKDIWEYSEKIEKTNPGRLAIIAKTVGASDNVIAILDTMKRGKEYDPKEVPWVWWPFLSNFSWWQLHQMLIEMKNDFPYEPPTEAGRAASDGFVPPEGEKARRKSTSLKPMILAIKEPIRYTPSLQPIPAKFGTRRPGWGILAFGGIAALIGGYTIYKIVSDKESEKD